MIQYFHFIEEKNIIIINKTTRNLNEKKYHLKKLIYALYLTSSTKF